MTGALPVWKRAQQTDDPYALILTNSDQVDFRQLRKGLELVKRACGGRSGSGEKLSAIAVIAIEQWLNNPLQPLPSHAYARISNWFLTALKVDFESTLAQRCAEFWDSLFVTRPPKRLTNEKPNDEIIEIRFITWWKQLERRQAK